jgi:hypothetical protein
LRILKMGLLFRPIINHRTPKLDNSTGILQKKMEKKYEGFSKS